MNYLYARNRMMIFIFLAFVGAALALGKVLTTDFSSPQAVGRYLVGYFREPRPNAKSAGKGKVPVGADDAFPRDASAIDELYGQMDNYFNRRYGLNGFFEPEYTVTAEDGRTQGPEYEMSPDKEDIEAVRLGLRAEQLDLRSEQLEKVKIATRVNKVFFAGKDTVHAEVVVTVTAVSPLVVAPVPRKHPDELYRQVSAFAAYDTWVQNVRPGITGWRLFHRVRGEKTLFFVNEAGTNEPWENPGIDFLDQQPYFEQMYRDLGKIWEEGRYPREALARTFRVVRADETEVSRDKVLSDFEENFEGVTKPGMQTQIHEWVFTEPGVVLLRVTMRFEGTGRTGLAMKSKREELHTWRVRDNAYELAKVQHLSESPLLDELGI